MHELYHPSPITIIANCYSSKMVHSAYSLYFLLPLAARSEDYEALSALPPSQFTIYDLRFIKKKKKKMGKAVKLFHIALITSYIPYRLLAIIHYTTR